ncbi:sensor histidine kinase [Alkalicoccobacillus porphyridii]|uniref:histidine kinase n=1 Tax=Alkalicoccobacillus porphyridii TaxID=2597270 RepID=A0A553ZWF2_9BACI|nr:HAMP domain-containing sensor histidine kinase [Alkalicoccobacillus porphyridii]TSB45797.1 HAMP domain-containing histidine kinase [Alkalicoccobacillus porphyridii]
MIKVNLTQRIWLAFISLILLVGLSIMIVYPLSIKGTLTEETYRMIEQAQLVTMPGLVPPTNQYDFLELQNQTRAVSHFIYPRYLAGDTTSATQFQIYQDMVANNEDASSLPPFEIYEEMITNALSQEPPRGRYEIQFGDATIFYVVLEGELDGIEPAYVISYTWDSYRNSMVDRLWERLLYLLMLTSVLALLPAIWLKYYLQQPLNILGNHLDQIANRDWQEPLQLEGDEDFKRLSNQFERMRSNLNSYDRAQKTFIQHTSHELKTPIMVIKSYAQSVKDGIMPKESLEQTMDVITEEANRMEKRVIEMLYFTKLEQMKKDQLNRSTFAFGTLAYQIEERFRYQRDNVKIHVLSPEVEISGDVDQLEVLLENLVENALRYATDSIWISAESVNGTIYLRVENNGDPIDSDELKELFKPFYKGNKGKFGLGLAIVKQIAELHHGSPRVENTEHGVRFTVSFPTLEQLKLEEQIQKTKKRDRKKEGPKE